MASPKGPFCKPKQAFSEAQSAYFEGSKARFYILVFNKLNISMLRINSEKSILRGDKKRPYTDSNLLGGNQKEIYAISNNSYNFRNTKKKGMEKVTTMTRDMLRL